MKAPITDKHLLEMMWERFPEIMRRGVGLAIPVQQEPFGYFKAEPFGWADCAETDEGAVALYTSLQPAQRTWVGLTDQEIDNLWNQHEPRFDYYSFSCDIEAKLKEKNNEVSSNAAD